MVGKSLSHYKIEAELGRGGMGIVYKAQDSVLDRIVAFKVLPQALVENAQAIQNFMREAKAAAKLNHPNIVTVYDTGEQQGRYYIAMEYVEGTTLKEILRRRGAISPSGILHVLVQICEALAYAHEKKVVHRDIKPANAMWTRDKKVKLMDFGLAKELPEGFGMGLFELMFSMMTLNEAAMVRAFRELGFKTKTGDSDTFVRIARRMMSRSDTGTFEGEFTEEMTNELFEAIREDPVVTVPSDFVLVGRVFGLLSGIAHTLGHRANVLAAMGATTG